MRLEKEGANWLITGLRGNTIFGSTLLGLPDLTLSSSDITCNTYLVVTVHNQGSTNASNVVVRANKTGCGSVESTISSIPAGSTGTANFSGTCAYCALGGTFTVTVDPDNSITESNESNNQATKNF
jgi:subtilase family serine protease